MEKHLQAQGIEYKYIDITENPPAAGPLAKMIRTSGLEVKKFINTSGQSYRAPGMKEKLTGATDQEKIRLLAADGRLIKRPLVSDGQTVTVGARPEALEAW